jgi:hypothetical protein
MDVGFKMLLDNKAILLIPLNPTMLWDNEARPFGVVGPNAAAVIAVIG